MHDGEIAPQVTVGGVSEWAVRVARILGVYKPHEKTLQQILWGIEETAKKVIAERDALKRKTP